MHWNRWIPNTLPDCSFLCNLGRRALVWIALVPCVIARAQGGPQFGPQTLEWPSLVSTQLPASGRGCPAVSWDGQELRGAGPGYQVRFDDRGFVFSTAGDATIRGVTESVGRRSDSRLDVQVVAAGSPIAAPQGVSYRRGAVVERYDLRADGVELTYVFDKLPRGAGDLVVRLRVATTLR